MKITYNPKLTERARELRNNSTLCEVLLWKQLKGTQMRGYDFHRQKPIGNYIVDFFCNKLQLAIEVDGSVHDHQFLADAKRQQILEKKGIRFIRVTNKMVKNEMAQVLRAIEDYIDEFEREA